MRQKRLLPNREWQDFLIPSNSHHAPSLFQAVTAEQAVIVKQ